MILMIGGKVHIPLRNHNSAKLFSAEILHMLPNVDVLYIGYIDKIPFILYIFSHKSEGKEKNIAQIVIESVILLSKTWIKNEIYFG